jgi:DNA-binding response OmpR family regulator
MLVIDDEPSVTKALATLLRRDGYTVDTADNGNRALALLEERRYDIILCDLRMPELDGPTFYTILTSQYPALCPRVVFLTGDTLSMDSLGFLEQCGQPWVPKPCTAAVVRRAIALVLHNAADDLDCQGQGREESVCAHLARARPGVAHALRPTHCRVSL